MTGEPMADGPNHRASAATRGDREPRGGRARRVAFTVILALTIAVLLLLFLPSLPLIATNWLPAEAWLAVRADRVAGDQVHRLHSMALAILSWGMLTGIALQVHRPRRKVAALLVAVAVPIAIAVAEALAGSYTVAGTGPFFALFLLVCALHPAARELVRLPRLDRTMTILVLVAGAPWLAYALDVAQTVGAMDTPHEVDHLEFMMALALLAPQWGLIAATDKSGWRIAVGAVLVLTACVALQSLIFPATLSGLSPIWAWAALAWCLAFGAAAWRRWRAAAAS